MSTNINALNGISNSFDPFGLMNFYDNTPKKRKGTGMAKMTNQNLPKAPKNPKGGAKPKAGKGGKKQAC